MSVSGSSGSSRADRIEVTPPSGGDGADGTAAAPAAGARRGTGTPGRMDVLSRVAAGTRPADPSTGLRTGIAVELPGTGVAVARDGTIAPLAAGADPLAALNTLALRPADAAGPFEGIADKALLSKVVAKLDETHGALLEKAPDDATALGWRQSRGAALHLMEQAALRAFALGDRRLGQEIVAKLVEAVKREPWRAVRDFAYQSLVTRAETKALPEVELAREAIYPSKPPYEKWLADGKIDIVLYCDDSGSLIADQVEFFKYQGFKDTKNADGSHTLKLAARGGKPAVVITIPPKAANDAPALFEKMDDPNVDVIGFTGHAGYGHRVDHALAHGVGGTGEGKLVYLFQCWGEGNVGSLERAYPDAQVLSTTAADTDNYDWTLMPRLIEGFRAKEGWEEISKKAIADLKREFKDDGEHAPEHWDGHYFFPTTRSTQVKHYDRDGDGVPDQNDHIFNVIYPKRIDAAGGYDPVVQSIPKYALDGTALTKAVSDLSLSIRYNHLLSPADERKVTWDPQKWRPGGFFEAAESADLRAFRFTKAADGSVEVALSTRFAHTQQEELSKMLAYEAGLWLGKEAGLDETARAGLGIGLLERSVHQQGTWYSAETGLLDEAWAEEALFMKRYGLDGFTFGELERLVGDPDEYKPETFKKVLERVRGLPGAAKLAGRPPARVGEELKPRTEVKFASNWIDQSALAPALQNLGIEGAAIKSFAPSQLAQNQPTNLVVVLEKDGKTFEVSLGIDSERVVRTAARFDLDLARKLEHTAHRSMEGLADGTKISKADAVAIYEKHRAAGKSFADALATSFAEVRTRVRPGTGEPALQEFQKLQAMGLLPPGDASKLASAAIRYYPDNASALAEKNLFAWVGDVAKRHGLDLDALEAKYLKEVATGGGSAGRVRGIAALLAALPQSAGKPESVALRDVLGGISGSLLLPPEEREKTLAAVRQRMGVKVPDLAAEALAATFPAGSLAGLEPRIIEGAAEGLRRALAGGKPLPDALEAAVVSLRKAGVPLSWQLYLGHFFSLGVVSSGSPEGNGLQARVDALRTRFSGEDAFFQWAAGLGGRDAKAIRELYFRQLGAASGGGPAAAVRAVLADLPRKPDADIGPIAGVLNAVPEADRVKLMSDILTHLGTTPAKAARKLVSAWGNDDATRAAALKAFDAKVRAGATPLEAAAAAADAVSLYNYAVGSPPQTLRNLGLATSEEALRLQPRFDEAQRRIGAESMLRSFVDNGPGDAARKQALLRDHRERLERGAPYADELFRFARALPALPEGMRGLVNPSNLVQLAQMVPPERRKELAEAFLEGQRVSKGDFAWKALNLSLVPTEAEGRRAFDAALADRKPLADAIIAGFRALNERRGEAIGVAPGGWVATLPLFGILTSEEVRRVSEQGRIASGLAEQTIGNLGRALAGGDLPAGAAERVRRRLARADATVAAGVDELLAALGTRPRSATPQPIPWSHLSAVLATVPVAGRQELAKRILERAGSTLEEGLREMLSAVASYGGSLAADAARAVFDREIRSGPRAALTAVIREAGLRSAGFLDYLANYGLIGPEDVQALRPLFVP